jgi:hypothetical protein
MMGAGGRLSTSNQAFQSIKIAFQIIIDEFTNFEALQRELKNEPIA